MNNRKKEYLERRRNRVKPSITPQKKTDYEKQRTREEVDQIKKDLINFAQTEWGKHWIQSNLKIGRPFRMQRGIEYVRDKRRIDNLSINPGQIFATVQGTAPTPYRVKINYEIMQETEWKIILEKIRHKVINLVELLEGYLPEDLILIFNESGYSLFPDASKGFNATCSCPDKAIPCKHIAALILYLALVIDYNPFLLLEFRGKPKDEILSDLRLIKSSKSKKDKEEKSKEQDLEFKFNVPKISIQEIINMQEVRDISNIEFRPKKPGKIIETLENLDLPQNNENKAFEIVLRDIYKKVTSEIYSMSSDFEV